VRLLLDKGADANLCNKAGSSPMHAALENGFGPVGVLLKERGGKDIRGSQPDSLTLK
jgi:ankyrin repeat protein